MYSRAIPKVGPASRQRPGPWRRRAKLRRDSHAIRLGGRALAAALDLPSLNPQEVHMAAPSTRSARASLATALAWAAVVLVLAAVFASGAGSNGAAATAAVALLLVALVSEVVHYRNRPGGRHG